MSGKRNENVGKIFFRAATFPSPTDLGKEILISVWSEAKFHLMTRQISLTPPNSNRASAAPEYTTI